LTHKPSILWWGRRDQTIVR